MYLSNYFILCGGFYPQRKMSKTYKNSLKLLSFIIILHVIIHYNPHKVKKARQKKNICLNIIHSRKKYLIIKLKEHERELLKRIPTHKWSCKQM